MKQLIVILFLVALLIPSPVMAWGPRTHVAIANELGEFGDEFVSGVLLPDFSLAYQRAGHSEYPNLQTVTHSPEFLSILGRIASSDFVRGWRCHVLADEIESAYSAERMGQGAPMSADWPVDNAYWPDAPWFEEAHTVWIQYVLAEMGVDVVVPPYRSLDAIYSWYIQNQTPKPRYQAVVHEWYDDYEDYVARSIIASETPVRYEIAEQWAIAVDRPLWRYWEGGE